MSYLISSRDLRLARRGAPELCFPDLAIGGDQEWGIFGPSGCGKTTLLHLLCGLLVASAGTLTIGGVQPGALRPAARDRWRGRHIGIVLQQPHLIPGLSVRQNLAAARYCAAQPRDDAAVEAALSALGLQALATRLPHTLSQGQAQRVAVARAVVNRPVLLLADEPTASLDDANADAVLATLRASAAASAACLVVVTHDQRLRSEIANRITLSGVPA